MIRPGTTADAAAIAAIYNHYVLNTIVTFEEDVVSVREVKQRIKEVTATFAWFVALEENRVVGYAYASKWKSRCAYRHSAETTVYLAKDATSRGLGTKLYTVLIADLRKRSIHSVIGGIALPNPASVALHEKLGFEKVAQFKEVGRKFDRWIDVGYWELML